MIVRFCNIPNEITPQPPTGGLFGPDSQNPFGRMPGYTPAPPISGGGWDPWALPNGPRLMGGFDPGLPFWMDPDFFKPEPLPRPRLMSAGLPGKPKPNLPDKNPFGGRGNGIPKPELMGAKTKKKTKIKPPSAGSGRRRGRNRRGGGKHQGGMSIKTGGKKSGDDSSGNYEHLNKFVWAEELARQEAEHLNEQADAWGDALTVILIGGVLAVVDYAVGLAGSGSNVGVVQANDVSIVELSNANDILGYYELLESIDDDFLISQEGNHWRGHTIRDHVLGNSPKKSHFDSYEIANQAVEDALLSDPDSRFNTDYNPKNNTWGFTVELDYTVGIQLKTNLSTPYVRVVLIVDDQGVHL